MVASSAKLDAEQDCECYGGEEAVSDISSADFGDTGVWEQNSVVNPFNSVSKCLSEFTIYST